MRASLLSIGLKCLNRIPKSKSNGATNRAQISNAAIPERAREGIRNQSWRIAARIPLVTRPKVGRLLTRSVAVGGAGAEVVRRVGEIIPGAVMIGAMVIAVVVKVVGVVRGMIVGIAEDIKAVVVLAGTMVGEAAGASVGSRYLLFDLSETYMIGIL